MEADRAKFLVRNAKVLWKRTLLLGKDLFKIRLKVIREVGFDPSDLPEQLILNKLLGLFLFLVL